MYCNGRCEHLNEKKHCCTLTGEKLSYMKVGSRKFGYSVHEHNGVCEQDLKDQGEKNG